MSYQPIELFRFEDIYESIEQKIASAQKAIKALFVAGRMVVIAFSGGRDSSTVASLALNAAREFVAEGGTPVLLVTTSNTLSENPEIVENFKREHDRMKQYAKLHGITLETYVVSPSLAASFQVKILSGRGIPSFPGGSGDCSYSLKVEPQRRFRNRLFAELEDAGRTEPCTLIGTRYSESERRAMNMRARGEKALEPMLNKDDEWVMSPIAYWDEDDIMTYMGMAKNGQFDAYSTFAETMDLYAHSAGTSCAVVAMAIEEGGDKRKKGGCGARHGCWSCQMAEDKSLKNMIEFDEQYEYARGLNKLNKFIRATRYDWSRRHWVGRTIKAGYIAIQPDTYHPSMIRELTRYMLQLDHDEYVRSVRTGEKRKFTILPVEMMIAIDALQSLNGIAKPFAMWADYRDITSGRVRYDVPDVAPFPVSDQPEATFLYVGEEWDDTAENNAFTGMRDAFLEAFTEGSNCAPELTQLKSGHMAWKIDSEQSFSVDSESAFMIAEFEIDRLAEMHDQGYAAGGIAAAYKWYLSYGCLNLSHSQKSEHDQFLRRTAYKDRLGLTLNYDVQELRKRSIPFSQLPAAARAAWANKATTESAQTDMFSEIA